MTDTAFLNRILIACSRGRVRLFRNSVGIGWIGKTERVTRPTQIMVNPGDVVIRKARALHAGLTEGSGDLIGWESREIKVEHVGQTWAVFASVEGKQGSDRLRPAQTVWRDQVRAAGGIAGVAKSPEDAREMFGEA
ncbi:MAG: VRR-NUC domain-containing protein [Xanthomonadales bacterium]|nr:VRR-NUC domain-containing protein [Xanthomonadales bacterium]